MHLMARKLPLGIVGLVAVLVGLLAVQVGAASAASCGSRTLSKAFSKFGDQADYFLLNGADFESSANGWGYEGGAKVTAGNETYNLKSGTSSVSIPVGGRVTSPWVCIGKDEPTLRFVTKTTGGLNFSQLNVAMEIRGNSGSVVNVYLGQILPLFATTWKPSPVYSYAIWTNQSWLFGSGDSVQVRFTFNVQGGNGTWSVDNAFVDPFKGF